MNSVCVCMSVKGYQPFFYSLNEFLSNILNLCVRTHVIDVIVGIIIIK